MRYHIVAYKEMPSKLRINGLVCNCKQVARLTQAEAKMVVQESRRYTYFSYGSLPTAKALYTFGPWLMDSAPFLVEVEKPIFVELTKKGEALPKKIAINDRAFTRAFDRYYLCDDPSQKEIQFIFDYMAPTYEADIDYDMNLWVNHQLMGTLPDRLKAGCPRILDYGVGTGICADAAPDIEEDDHNQWGIVGLDISRQMIEQARQKVNSDASPASRLLEVHFMEDGVSLLDAKSFDGAMACFTVHYFLNPQPYREICRLLKPEALFVCNVAQDGIRRTEIGAAAGGLVAHKDCRQKLHYEVRGQKVWILTFCKPHEGE